MRILDRYILRNFLLNCLMSMVVLMGVVVLLDLIVNFDRFLKGAKAAQAGGAMNILGDIVEFYGYQMLVIFQYLAGVIPLLAAGFTMVRMTRQNELSAMLSSGVSLYRVAAPIVLFSIVFSLLAVVDQEVLMPRFQDKLMRRHDEVNKAAAAYMSRHDMLPDHENVVLFSGYDRGKQMFRKAYIIWRDPQGNPSLFQSAQEMRWEANPDKGLSGDKPEGGLSGRWVLSGNVTSAEARSGNAKAPASVSKNDPYYTTGLEPKHVDLFLSKKAVDFLSLTQVYELIGNSTPNTRPNLEKIMHTRVTQPVMNIIMLLLGIPLLLTRDPKQLLGNLLKCMLVVGICFAATFISFQMGADRVPPLLSAWLPVLIFGPLALAMLDTLQT